MKHFVHVAGWGAVTGFGAGREALWSGIVEGRSALRERRRTASAPAPTDVAAEVPGLEDVVVADRALSIAKAAAHEALRAAGGLDSAQVPLVLASTKGELTGIGLGAAGSGFGSPARLARRLADELGSPSVLGAVSCACASGVTAIALAARAIERGEVERALVVGVDVLDEFILAGFGGLQALDRGACRPFDRARRGLSLGDGACAVVLSRFERESRGARIAGRGGANDACHVTGPDRAGDGIAAAGARALRLAGIAPQAVDAVHVHGTGTLANDACEALGLVQLFGGATPPAFGTKAQTGHTLGAAGVLETCVLAEALLAGELPPNVGLEDADVDPRLDLVRSRRSVGARDGGRVGLKVSSGFGGIVAALVVAT